MSCQTNVYFCSTVGMLRRREPVQVIPLGFFCRCAKPKHACCTCPHCGRDSASIAPYIALTVLFCPGCALKNNAVQPWPVRRLKLRRANREYDLKIPFNFRYVFAVPLEKRDSSFVCSSVRERERGGREIFSLFCLPPLSPYVI